MLVVFRDRRQLLKEKKMPNFISKKRVIFRSCFCLSFSFRSLLFNLYVYMYLEEKKKGLKELLLMFSVLFKEKEEKKKRRKSVGK